MTQFRTRCRGSTCGGWVLMSDRPTGKLHPYDWPLSACSTCGGKGGTTETRMKSMFDGGGTEEAFTQCAKCQGRGKAYVSHYRTCPNADEFRWKKEPKEVES